MEAGSPVCARPCDSDLPHSLDIVSSCISGYIVPACAVNIWHFSCSCTAAASMHASLVCWAKFGAAPWLRALMCRRRLCDSPPSPRGTPPRFPGERELPPSSNPTTPSRPQMYSHLHSSIPAIMLQNCHLWTFLGLTWTLMPCRFLPCPSLACRCQ